MRYKELFESENPAYYSVHKEGGSFKITGYDTGKREIPKYTKDGLSASEADSMADELRTEFGAKNISTEMYEPPLQGHMGIDFIADTMQNAAQINAFWHECGGDMDCVIGKLEANPSWRFILDKKGRDFAAMLVKKNIGCE